MLQCLQNSCIETSQFAGMKMAFITHACVTPLLHFSRSPALLSARPNQKSSKETLKVMSVEIIANGSNLEAVFLVAWAAAAVALVEVTFGFNENTSVALPAKLMAGKALAEEVDAMVVGLDVVVLAEVKESDMTLCIEEEETAGATDEFVGCVDVVKTGDAAEDADVTREKDIMLCMEELVVPTGVGVAGTAGAGVADVAIVIVEGADAATLDAGPAGTAFDTAGGTLDAGTGGAALEAEIVMVDGDIAGATDGAEVAGTDAAGTLTVTVLNRLAVWVRSMVSVHV